MKKTNLSTKICVPNETKDINIKEITSVTRVNEVKTVVNHISYDCKCKFNSATSNSNKNGIMLTVSGNDFNWNSNTSVCEGI